MQPVLKRCVRVAAAVGLTAANGLFGAAPVAGKVSAPVAVKKTDTGEKGILATFDGGRVSVAEIQAEIDRRAASSYFRRRLQTPDGRRQFVEGIVRSRVLAAEARKRGLDKDPQVRARIDAILAAELERRLRQERAPLAVSDDEARKYYDTHKTEFERPERKRLTQIFLKLPANASEKEKTAKLTAAREILDELKKAGPDKQAAVFAKLAATRSDDPLGRRYRGMYGYVSAGMKPSARYPQEVIDTVAKLTKPGQISDLVRAPDGLHILRLERVIPARKQTFEQALTIIKARLRSRRISDIRLLAADIFKKAGLKINDEALAALRVPAPPSANRFKPMHYQRRKSPNVVKPVGIKPRVVMPVPVKSVGKPAKSVVQPGKSAAKPGKPKPKKARP
ncbi:MAG: hypothetical protein GXP31_19150 [Kiritimatiellaeota bacterium]|nr:hypothetical protein [Kiritimatiellota bacterium]